MMLTSTSWLVLVVVVVISIVWLWRKTRHPYNNVNIPPFPVQPWPFVGHFLMLGPHLQDKLKYWRKNTGGVYSLLFGKELNIVVNDFDIIQEIMIKHQDNIINIPESYVGQLLNEFNRGIVFARDDNWKEQRATSLSILRYLGMGKEIMTTKIHEEVSFLVDQLTSLEDQSTDPSSLINACVSNVMFSISVGKRFQHTDPEFIGLIEAKKNISMNVINVILLRPFKFLLYLPGDLFKVKTWRTSAMYLTDIIKAYIEEIKQCSHEHDEPTNFIAGYVEEMKKRKEKGLSFHLSEKDLIPIVRTLFIAGTESSSATILWCLLYILHNPEVQEKVYREIESTVGTARYPTMADKSNLPYLNAVILETQRMASVVPASIQREIKANFEVQGFTFPKGGILWTMLDSVLHDTKIWGDPHIFRPERFIDDNGALINREELIPFGIGRRTCPGEAMAKMEIFLFLSALFQRFRFESADKHLTSLECHFWAVCKPNYFCINPIIRNKSNLFPASIVP